MQPLCTAVIAQREGTVLEGLGDRMGVCWGCWQAVSQSPAPCGHVQQGEVLLSVPSSSQHRAWSCPGRCHRGSGRHPAVRCHRRAHPHSYLDQGRSVPSGWGAWEGGSVREQAGVLLPGAPLGAGWCVERTLATGALWGGGTERPWKLEPARQFALMDPEPIIIIIIVL